MLARRRRTLALLLMAAAWLAVAPRGAVAADPAEDVDRTTLTTVGRPAPDFTITTLDGTPFHLAEQRGQTVLLNFFATWCPPCREEMPHLQRLWERWGSAGGVVILCIARAETPTEVNPFRAKHELTLPMACDPQREVYARYASGYIPRTYVIDPDGIIRLQTQGFEPAEFARIAELLDAVAPSSP